MIDGYPDEDCPWTFYFNGQEMPKWTSTWSLIPTDNRHGEDDDWITDLCWRIYCRIDHLGNIETEDSNLVRVCLLWHMRCLVERETEVRQNISERLSESEQREPVFENLFDGLNKMFELSHEREVCCWTNGYARDQERLVEFISQTHDLFPHQKSRLQELESRSFREVKQMRRIASTKKLPKSIREKILERKP
jgi:hypothetical protein